MANGTKNNSVVGTADAAVQTAFEEAKAYWSSQWKAASNVEKQLLKTAAGLTAAVMPSLRKLLCHAADLLAWHRESLDVAMAEARVLTRGRDDDAAEIRRLKSEIGSLRGKLEETRQRVEQQTDMLNAVRAESGDRKQALEMTRKQLDEARLLAAKRAEVLDAITEIVGVEYDGDNGTFVGLSGDVAKYVTQQVEAAVAEQNREYEEMSEQLVKLGNLAVRRAVALDEIVTTIGAQPVSDKSTATYDGLADEVAAYITQQVNTAVTNEKQECEKVVKQQRLDIDNAEEAAAELIEWFAQSKGGPLKAADSWTKFTDISSDVVRRCAEMETNLQCAGADIEQAMDWLAKCGDNGGSVAEQAVANCVTLPTKAHAVRDLVQTLQADLRCASGDYQRLRQSVVLLRRKAMAAWRAFDDSFSGDNYLKEKTEKQVDAANDS